MNARIITPEEFEERMKEIKNKNYDTEGCHIDMDDLMCKVLCRLGYSKGIEVYNDTGKWYA